MAISPLRFVGYALALFLGAGIISISAYTETQGKPLEALRSLFSPRMSVTEKNTDGSLDEMRPFGPDDHVWGESRSPITIITYGDTECPYTKKFFLEMQKVMSEYGNGTVAWVYRHFPNKELHPQAWGEAEAAECAGRVGGKMKFWEYLQGIFSETQSHNTLDKERLTWIAEELGIPINEFNECRVSRTMASRVSQDAQNAYLLGARGTPTSIIIMRDGEPIKIDGYMSSEEVIEQIKLLSASSGGVK
ncbi:MAG: thioredoxin domain-containing protein [Patescibacteria group bacterium]